MKKEHGHALERGRALVALLGLGLAACGPARAGPPSPPGWPAPLSPGRGLRFLYPGHALDAHAPSAHRCAGALRLAEALPDPTRLPDRIGEWVRIVNDGPVATPLRGWRLGARRHARRLPALVLAPGAELTLTGHSGPRSLGPVRLTNRGASLSLLDPCGLVVDRLCWGLPGCPHAGPNTVVRHRRPWSPTPARDEDEPGEAATGARVPRRPRQ